MKAIESSLLEQDEGQTTMANVTQVLRENCLEPATPPTPGDGNCFFHAVAYLYTKATAQYITHLTLRSAVCSYLENGGFDQLPEVAKQEAGNTGKWLGKMRQRGTWADHIVVAATSLLLHADIKIFAAEGLSRGVSFTPPAELVAAPIQINLGYLTNKHFFAAEEISHDSSISNTT